jgi:hypothetical protein
MNLHASLLRQVRLHGATDRRFCSAPFGKGGYEGFAFALAFEQLQRQRQIPPNPPFSKGEAELLSRTADATGKGAS